MKDKSNFHLSCPKGFLYDGDVNIEYGGVFLDVREGMEELAKAIREGKAFEDWFNFWEVSELSMMDNQWLLEAGTFLVVYDPCMEDEYREGDMARKYQKITPEAWVLWRWWETHAKDVLQSQTVQIGHDTTYASSTYKVPDHIYHAHKQLHNVAREWLKEV